MTTLRTLHDAFATLEERADDAASLDYPLPERPRRGRLAAPLATAAAVLAVAAGIAAWQASRDGHPAKVPAAGGPTPTLASTTGTAQAGGFHPPSTVAALTATARSILAGTARITVDPKRSSACGAALVTVPTSTSPVGPAANPAARPAGPPTPTKAAGQPECSGAALVGTLTSAGMTGGFDLDVYRSPDSRPFCDDQASCTPRALADGSQLATSTWHDSEVPGGMTYQVDFVRRDGAEIVFHLSTEHDPKGASVVTAPHVPLTVEQMTLFVTSDRW